MNQHETIGIQLHEDCIDAVSAFEIACNCIRKYSPDYWDPPFAIRYHEQAEQWIVSTKIDAPFGNAEVMIDAGDGRIIEVAWTPTT